MTDEVKKLKEWTDKAQRIVFFGGAGVSTVVILDQILVW